MLKTIILLYIKNNKECLQIVSNTTHKKLIIISLYKIKIKKGFILQKLKIKMIERKINLKIYK
jgi:uncharacterized protein YpmS